MNTDLELLHDILMYCLWQQSLSSSFWSVDWNMVHDFFSIQPHTTTVPSFNYAKDKAFWKNMGKGEYAGNQHFLFFTQCFLSFLKVKFCFCSNLGKINIWTFCKESKKKGGKLQMWKGNRTAWCMKLPQGFAARNYWFCPSMQSWTNFRGCTTSENTCDMHLLFSTQCFPFPSIEWRFWFPGGVILHVYISK